MSLPGFLPEVGRRLEEFLSRPRTTAAVATFDLDGTCEHHDVGEAVFYAMAREELFNLEALRDEPAIWEPFVRYPTIPSPKEALDERIRDPATQPAFAHAMIRAYLKLLEIAGRPTAFFWAGQVLAGLTVERVREISRRVIARDSEVPLGNEWFDLGPGSGDRIELAIGLRTYPPMVELLRRMQAAGIEVWFISASNRWTVEVYAGMFFGIPPERIVGVTPLVHDGCINGRPDPDVPVTGGPGKVLAIDRFIKRRPLFAAGDSISDWEMLCAATELRLVIDKGNVELRRLVAERRKSGEDNWLVQPRFIQPPDWS